MNNQNDIPVDEKGLNALVKRIATLAAQGAIAHESEHQYYFVAILRELGYSDELTAKYLGPYLGELPERPKGVDELGPFERWIDENL